MRDREIGQEKGVYSMKRFRKGFPLFQKRTEPESGGIPLRKPVVLRTQAKDAINLALIVLHLDHKRSLTP